MPNSGWRGNINEIPELGKFRKISISHYIDNNNNICYLSGIPSVELFELKQRQKIKFITERWKYADASRTIRPIMIDEANEIIKILDRENSDISERREITPNALNGHKQIELILNPNIVENEKIVEGWILENIGRNNSLDQIIGPISCFGNNIPAGYLKFMDIFGYQNLIYDSKKYKIVEVKLNQCQFPNDVNQLLGYMDWTTEIIANSDYKSVEGILFTKGCEQNTIDFINNFNTLGRKIRLIEFDYDRVNFNRLQIECIV